MRPPYDYWTWWRRETGDIQIITIGAVTRRRIHSCVVPDPPAWIESDERFGPFGLFHRTVLHNPLALESGDVWECPECSAKWVLSGQFKGGDDL